MTCPPYDYPGRARDNGKRRKVSSILRIRVPLPSYGCGTGELKEDSGLNKGREGSGGWIYTPCEVSLNRTDLEVFTATGTFGSEFQNRDRVEFLRVLLLGRRSNPSRTRSLTLLVFGLNLNPLNRGTRSRRCSSFTLELFREGERLSGLGVTKTTRRS